MVKAMLIDRIAFLALTICLCLVYRSSTKMICMYFIRRYLDVRVVVWYCLLDIRCVWCIIRDINWYTWLTPWVYCIGMRLPFLTKIACLGISLYNYVAIFVMILLNHLTIIWLEYLMIWVKLLSLKLSFAFFRLVSAFVIDCLKEVLLLFPIALLLFYGFCWWLCLDNSIFISGINDWNWPWVSTNICCFSVFLLF